MATPIPNEERLFSLVLALLATETGLTKADVLSSVQGYRQRYRQGGENASLERQFERDKDDVRDLGVPLETIESTGDSGVQRYRIPKGSYDLPGDVRFTPQEIALLNLAALVWREGSLSGDSRRAMIKLRSLGIESDEPLLGYAPRLRARDAAFAPLSSAIERRAMVRFDYLKPGDPAAEGRLLAPLSLVQFGGRWHVHGIDQVRGEPRTFLLSRIVGDVVATGARFPAAPGDPAADALAALRRVTAANRALISARAGSDASARLARRGAVRDDGLLEVHYPDPALFADELAGFGPEVRVLQPADLVDAVRARLAATVAAHVDAPPEAEG